MAFSFSDCPNLSDYIQRYQVDGLMWKAEQLLAGVDNLHIKNDRVNDIARTIALIPAEYQVTRDEYVQKVAKVHGLNRKTLEKLVTDQELTEGRKRGNGRKARKNTIVTLNGDASTYRFFVEKTNKDGEFTGIRIDKLQFVQLLGSFGFTRYADEADTKDGYTFVRLISNVIREVSGEEIKDFVEEFITKNYDFDGAGYEHADAPALINHFYDNMSRLFSKDLFARVRNPNPIVISRDTETECYLYFQNGFVRVTKDDYELHPYDHLDGSVWESQMLKRSFKKVPIEMVNDGNGKPDLQATFAPDWPVGVFADFVWRLSGERDQRFWSLCTILGYLVHDYYNYKLKAVLLTDSTISDESEGRTGKTLVMQLLGLCRSYCEVNGKTFRVDDERKYQTADRSTQILHINDISHNGRNKLDFESLFNDITEGYYVKALYKSPFRQRSKIALSSNRTVRFAGASARDRVVEFEVSNFFGEDRSPLQYYGQWLGRWDEAEFNKFDNFICFVVQLFLLYGIVPPEEINMGERKLRDQTCGEFLDFMDDISEAIKAHGEPWPGYLEAFVEKKHQLEEVELDTKKLYEQFLNNYPDWKAKKLFQKSFNRWLHLFAQYRLRVIPQVRKSNGKVFIQFKQKVS